MKPKYQQGDRIYYDEPSTAPIVCYEIISCEPIYCCRMIVNEKLVCKTYRTESQFVKAKGKIIKKGEIPNE